MKRTVLTLDVDWAPDAAIDAVAEILRQAGVRSTWFVTHASPAIDRLRAQPDLFELGIHPNFLPGSSHGAAPQEVLEHCMRLVPDAVSMRTHALVQSTPLFDLVLRATPVRCDASLLLSHASFLEAIEYQWGGTTMLRIPYHWEDDIEMLRDEPRWDLSSALRGDGLRVFDFHPIHVFLNSANMEPYRRLKTSVPSLAHVNAEQMQPFVNEGAGARDTFVALVEHLRDVGSERIRDVYDEWRQSR